VSHRLTLRQQRFDKQFDQIKISVFFVVSFQFESVFLAAGAPEIFESVAPSRMPKCTRHFGGFGAVRIACLAAQQ
jgi:hypothetical protein